MIVELRTLVITAGLAVTACTYRPVDLLKSEQHSSGLSGIEVTERLAKTAVVHQLKIKSGKNAAGIYVEMASSRCFYAIQGYTDRSVSLDSYLYPDAPGDNCTDSPTYEAIRSALGWSS